MQPLANALLNEVFVERRRLASRRGLLGTTTRGIGALALAATAFPVTGGIRAVLAQTEFADDVDVLNFALTLEHLEATFYREGLEQFDDAAFGESPFGRPISEFLAEIRDHEVAHVDALTSTIEALGGEPVAEAEYDFGVTDAATFLATAQALENTGVSAYDGAAQFLTDPELLTTAGTIVAVEARHAAYLNLLNGILPFPAAFETPLTPDEVLAIAGPFIVGSGAAATPAG